MHRSSRLHRVHFAAAFALLSIFATANGAAPTSPRPTAREALDRLADDYWQFFLRENPEAATMLGDYRYNSRLTDYSLAHVPVLRSELEALLARARAVDTRELSSADRLDQQMLVRALGEQLEAIRLQNYEMPINQMDGVHLVLPQITAIAPFDTVAHFDEYVARLEAVPTAIDQVIELARAGVKDGLVPPRFLLEKTVGQCAAVADAAGAANPFAEPATRIPESIAAAERERIHGRILAAVDTKVRPAYARLCSFLAQEYAPHGRTQPGVWSLPDGDARYRYAIRTQTTTNLTADEIHSIGLAQVADLEQQITALAKSAGYPDRAAFEKAVYADPKLHATSRQQILDNFTHYIGQMEPKLPELFGRLPRSKLIVTNVPAYMEKESSTQYVSGTPDGSRPGQVWVVTYDYATHDVLDDEATAYHEGVPGHHLQISIKQETPGLRQFHLIPGYNAYVEGWALYSERLGKEVGFYQNPASDLGRLRSELYRALRLVVDTGVHGKRWTRQQMVDYWNQHLPPASDAEMDRYIVWPGQALGYKLGQLKILELRQRAQSELGPKFDIRAFHDQILGAGPMPLDLLEAHMVEWIASVQKH